MEDEYVDLVVDFFHEKYKPVYTGAYLKEENDDEAIYYVSYSSMEDRKQVLGRINKHSKEIFEDSNEQQSERNNQGVSGTDGQTEANS